MNVLGVTDAEYIAASHQERMSDDRTARTQFRDTWTTTVEELCQCMESDPPTERRPTTYQSQPRKYGNTARTASLSMPTKPRKDSSKTPEKKTVTCYKCNKLGYYARECTEEAFLLKKTVKEDQSYKHVGTVN